MQGKTTSESLNFNDFLNEELDNTSDYITELSTFLTVNKLTVSVIESITGGGIARKLVEVPGCSSYFLGVYCVSPQS